eukprot:TRINITY_DN7290_c0_g2_i1.p1 TRINITY_DN7290_c0_g2~~TRINITY_DN7290_c0_g2_i1.p1  ORF type:complete len:335 (-),score=64.99 TRINITY_DN7290_c0_g2_i1:148-1152(-)
MAAPDIEDLEACYGFSRKDKVDDSKVHGTTDTYYRHLFVCSGMEPMEWPSSLVKSSNEQLVAVLTELGRVKKSFPKATIVNVTNEKPKGAGLDVVLFPDNVRFTGVTAENVAQLIEDLAKPSDPDTTFAFPHEKVSGDWIFVCAHNAKDQRCGVCGPKLIDLFKKKVEERVLDAKVFATSHVGGHKYAGNVIVFPPGDWYGNVCPSDVSEIIEKHVLSGETVYRLWRGRMGLDKTTVLNTLANLPGASTPSTGPAASSTPASNTPARAFQPIAASNGLRSSTNGVGVGYVPSSAGSARAVGSGGFGYFRIALAVGAVAFIAYMRMRNRSNNAAQ